jgi:hypothetical protein
MKPMAEKELMWNTMQPGRNKYLLPLVSLDRR